MPSHHHKPPHEKPHPSPTKGPIGMVPQRSHLATFLAFGLVGFVILLILAVIAYLLFS